MTTPAVSLAQPPVDDDAPVDAAAVEAPPAKPPADAAAREKERLRAKKRRLAAKLQEAKSEDDIKRLVKKLGAGDEADAEAQLAAGAALKPLEPGQRPGWPAPSDVAAWEKTLKETFATAPELAGGFVLTGDAQADRAAVAVLDALKGDAGERLAKAWAPIAALYAPAILTSPWAGAIGGTFAAGVMIAAAVSEATKEPEQSA